MPKRSTCTGAQVPLVAESSHTCGNLLKCEATWGNQVLRGGSWYLPLQVINHRRTHNVLVIPGFHPGLCALPVAGYHDEDVSPFGERMTEWRVIIWIIDSNRITISWLLKIQVLLLPEVNIMPCLHDWVMMPRPALEGITTTNTTKMSTLNASTAVPPTTDMLATVFTLSPPPPIKYWHVYPWHLVSPHPRFIT